MDQNMSMILMMVLLFALMYFMMIRPENKRKKKLQEMRDSLKKGDTVTTIGGIIGTVVHVKDDKIVVETGADQVRIELAKWALSTNDSAAERAKEEKQKSMEAKAKAVAAKKAERAKKNDK